jgi:hypothetical protein
MKKCKGEFIMGKICENCVYWGKKEDSTGECELRPIPQDHNKVVDAFGNGEYKTTKAKDTCSYFSAKM